MEIEYLGYKIEIIADRVLKNYKFISFKIYNSVGDLIDSGFSDTMETIEDMIVYTKKCVDEYLDSLYE